ncbi:hypothetical protein [Pedobacter paludis]|uniref:Uncharacterized protein n=1 Tax=Pedobacter paludis TaxID=2203212 RepID=A0A317F1Q8_9SPHI|nr:hypothetical protein [Pedobacter paludis]PWS32193.1 hypothetical protein DF947_10515 [Pedobacter paludis]
MEDKIIYRAGQILFGSAVFEPDYSRRQFVDTEKAENVIPFSSLYHRNGWSSEMVFNSVLRRPHNVFTDKNVDPLLLLKIVLPNELLRPDNEISQNYLKDMNAQALYSRWNIGIVTQAIANRLNGNLPQVDLMGDQWKVDISNRRLFRENGEVDEGEQKRFTIIRLNGDFSEHGTNGFQFPYNTSEKRKENLPMGSMLELPKNVVFLRIPDELTLDQVGYSIRERNAPTDLLTRLPFNEKHKGEKVGWPVEILRRIDVNRQLRGLKSLEIIYGRSKGLGVR